jgi:4-amino-4-deoxy-L-arabinose transferase-like glycosyltransferase
MTTAPGRLSLRDGLILAAILAVAAVLRFVGLPGRGAWDDDQGDEMLAMLAWVRDGHAPLLGPVSSIGTAHHGVGFYWILAPSAFLTDANPVAAAATLAVVGIAGVAATWWLGRTVGGPLAGHLAGLLMGVSPSAIGASTFVWNSNIVAPFAAVAFAAGWHAWRTHRARWWLAVAVATLFMLHGHLLASIALPPIGALLVADILRRPRAERLRMLPPVLGAAAIVAAGYMPILIYEVRNDFPETAALAHYVTQAGTSHGLSMVVRPLIILWRILAWPVSGHVPSSVLGGLPAAFIATIGLILAASGKPGIARQFGRWAVGTIAWAVLALTFVTPTLAEFVEGLPNDQYHAWLDPILFAIIGVAVARLRAMRARVGRASAIAIVVSCLALSLASVPPLRSPDGGWPRAAESAGRIRAVGRNQWTAVIGVAKSGAALAFPLHRDGQRLTSASTADVLVVTCDRLFERAVGVPCGGSAELAVARQFGFPAVRLVDRFEDGPRRVICVFARQ